MSKNNLSSMMKKHIATLIIASLSVCTHAVASEQVREGVPVYTVTAERSGISAFVYGEGTSRAVRREFLTFESNGKVAFIRKNSDGSTLKEGDSVKGPSGKKTGSLLAYLDQRSGKSTMTSARASLTQSQASLDVAKKSYQRSKTLLAKGLIPRGDFDQAEAQYKQAQSAIRSAQAQVDQAAVGLDQSALHAPFDGIVAYMNIREGQYYSVNQFNSQSEESALQSAAIVVIDPSEYEITLDLPIFDGGQVKVGQRAWLLNGETISAIQKQGEDLETLLDKLIPATVYAVSPSINPKDRSIRVKVRTVKPTDVLNDGAFVTVWIETARKDDALVVPFNALIHRGDNNFAFVVDDATGKVTRKAIKPGLFGIQGVEVISGINDGEHVVTRGRTRLANDMQVRIVNTDGEGVE